MGLTCLDVSGSVALNSGSSVYVMFPLTFCYLSSGNYFTQFRKSVVDTQWKQSTHHLAPAALKRHLGIFYAALIVIRNTGLAAVNDVALAKAPVTPAWLNPEVIVVFIGLGVPKSIIGLTPPVPDEV